MEISTNAEFVEGIERGIAPQSIAVGPVPVAGSVAAGTKKRRRMSSDNSTPAKAAKKEVASEKKSKEAVSSELKRPVGPCSPYSVFLHETLSPAVVDKTSHVEEARHMWCRLCPEDKLAFHEKFEKQKELYDAQIAAYEKSLTPAERKAVKATRQPAKEPAKLLQTAVGIFFKEKPYAIGYAAGKWSQQETASAASTLNQMWNALGPNDQSPYHTLSDKLKQDYDTKLAAYKKSLSSPAKAELRKKNKEHAAQQKAREASHRATLRQVGDSLKGCLQICRVGGRHGDWTVPPGHLRVVNINFDTFHHMFGSVMKKLSPSPCSVESAVIAGEMTGDEAGHIFGVTKIRGGSMYAKFVISSMTVMYRPKDKSLQLAYVTEETF